MPILLALLSSGLWGSADFLGGLLSRRLKAVVVVAASQTAGLLAVSLVAVATGGFSAGLGWLPWAVLSGACGAVGLVCFYAALASGTMGVVSPIAALGAVIPVLVGLLSGEHPSTLSAAGIVVALAGAVAASGPELRGSTGAGPRPVVLAAVAGVGFGLALTFIAKGAETDAVMTLWGMRLTSVTGFAVAAVVARTIGGLHPEDLVPIALVGVGDVVANLLFALASQRGYVSVTAVLASLYPVVTVLLARAILHERLLRIQQLGVVGALAGVALVSFG